MLTRLENSDWIIIGRGVAALLACIIIGSIIVEIQLNKLTYWQDFVQVFNVKQIAEGAYLAYALGSEYYLQAAWQIGSVHNTQHDLHLSLLGLGITLPTKLEFELAPVAALIQAAWRRGIESAFEFKQIFYRFCVEAEPLMLKLKP